MASLNHSSSVSSLGSALMSATTSTTRPLREAAEQQCRILLLIDAQPDPAPFQDVPLARDQVFDKFHAPAPARRTDLDIAKMKPELAWSGPRQRYGNGDRIDSGHRFLDEANHLAVVDLGKTQIIGLQQGGVVPADAVEASDITFDVARLIPVTHFQFVFLGVEVFLLSGDRFMLQELEAIVDAVIAGQRGGERHPRLEDPRLAAL